jgi:CheY-like chemotaxis protein
MMKDFGAGEGTAAVERGSLEGKTILVVEKEPLIALDLQRALEAAGAEVIVARNAKEAVSRIKKSRFAAGVKRELGRHESGLIQRMGWSGASYATGAHARISPAPLFFSLHE